MPLRDDDYELMPATELEYLRHEVEKMKRNPLGDTQASISLLDALNKLNHSIERLNTIFESANDDMVKTLNEASVQEQMRKMSEQQEKLARGIVAVAELVKEVQQKQENMPSMEQMIADVKAREIKSTPKNPFEDTPNLLPNGMTVPQAINESDIPPPPPRRV